MIDTKNALDAMTRTAALLEQLRCTTHDAALAIALMHDSLLTAKELEAKYDAIGDCVDAMNCRTCGHAPDQHFGNCRRCLCKGYEWKTCDE